MSAREEVLSNPHYLEQIISKYEELNIAGERSNATEASTRLANLNSNMREINAHLAAANQIANNQNAVIVDGVDQRQEQIRVIRDIWDARIDAFDSYVNVAVEKARLQLINRNFRTTFNSLPVQYMP